MKKQIYKTKLKKGDMAIVISGKNRGKKGKILNVDLKKGRVVLEGVNQRKKFIRPNQDAPKGGVVNVEAPINLSNVLYYDEKTKRGARIGFEFDPKDPEKKYRVVRSGKQSRRID